jgi:hypothetical protein
MAIPIDPLPPPWGEDMEEAWKAQYKALRQHLETGRGAGKSGWRKRFAAKTVLTAGLTVLFFCGLFLYGAFSGDL